jgi:hypothetical protein
MSFMGVRSSIEPVVRRILWGVALLVASVGVLAGLILAYQWSVPAFVAACLLVPAIALVTGARTWRSLAVPRKPPWVRTPEGVVVIAVVLALAEGLVTRFAPDLGAAISLGTVVVVGALLLGPIAVRVIGPYAKSAPAPTNNGPSLGYLGTTWLERGPAYRRKRAVLLLGAVFNCVYSVPWVLALPGAGFTQSVVAGLVLSLAALAYLYWGVRRYLRKGELRWNWLSVWLVWAYLAVQVVLLLVWTTVGLVVFAVVNGIAGFLLAPSSIVELWVNLRRELPVETRARAQLTATAESASPSL